MSSNEVWKSSRVARPVAAALMLIASACEPLPEDTETSTSPAVHEHGHDHGSELLQSTWTFCAIQNARCAFSGTRAVRYGTDARSVMIFATGGIDCSNAAFNVSYGLGNNCKVLLEQEVAAAPAPMAGPFINRNAIPRGNPGVATAEIAATSEQALPYEIGAFRTSCSFSHMNNDDPIVYPGQPGKAHLHAYFGNTGANAMSTPQSLRTTGNSTCRGGILNRSAYWVPALIEDNGTPIKPKSAQIYYKTGYEGVRPNQVQAFPQGLRMIAGDAKANAPGQPHTGWNCETYGGRFNAIPDCQAGDAVIMMVQFPQCWNGKDLDSADHKSHMAYPVNGGCPNTHPIAIPEITFNIYYDVPAGKRSALWRLSSDMYSATQPGGYSSHADWYEGWDPTIASTFVRNCDQASRDCHSHLLGDGRMLYNSLEPN